MAGPGRPLGSQNKDKPFREALRMELAALKDDDPKALRGLARNLLLIASGTDGLSAIREVADRLDGKPAQAMQHSGSVGTYDLSSVSDDDLNRLEQILAPAAELGGNTGGTEPTQH